MSSATIDWDAAWRVAANEAYVSSPAYDSHCFDPLPHRPHSPSRTGSLKFVPLDEILWAKEPGNYKTRCPVHEDDEASLSILVTDEGRVLVNCFAGCEWRLVQDYIKEHS